MPPGGKKPLKRVRTSRFDSTLSEPHNFTPSLERTQGNLDTLRRGLILPQATYKYPRIADDEIRLLHIFPADDKRDMLHTELRTAKSNDPLLHYVALSYTWGNEEPTEKLWILKPESWPASPRPPNKPIDRFVNHAWEIVKEIVKEKHRLKPNATFYVRPNLDDALRHLRNYSDREQDQLQHEPETLILWVDCICINQNDEKEMSIQVSRMANVYEHAEGVWIWLGKESEDSCVGMDFVGRIPELERGDRFTPQGSSAQEWSAFIALMKREWFRRRWVVQELAFAKEAFLLCGDSTVHWGDYCSAVEIYLRRADTIAALYKESPDFKHQLMVLGDLKASGAGKMISVTNEYVRSKERFKDLETLVSELTMFEAGDPRDAVYALMTLAKDVQPNSQQHWPLRQHNASEITFTADYTKNILQVFTDFVAFCITKSRQLDIICRKWAPNRKIKRLTIRERLEYRGRKPPAEVVQLPSWIGLLEESAFGMPRSGPSSRIAGNSLVVAERPYHACGDSEAEILFGEIDVDGDEGQASLDLRKQDLLAHPSNFKTKAKDILGVRPRRISDGTMYVRGFRVRVIEKISHRLYEGMMPREWLKLGLKTPGTSSAGEAKDHSDELWRTLVANRTSEGKDPPSSYLNAMEWAIELRNVNGDIHTAELIRQGKPPWITVEFLKRVQEVIWDKRFFTLADARELQYHFGIAPSRAKVGDLIVILLGCRVPVVLSPLNEADPRCGFRLIGEAYLHGMMDGEVLRLKEYGRCRSGREKDIIESSEEFCLL